MAIPRIPTPANPALFDKFINQFNNKLSQKVTWLDHLFGQCEKVIKDKNAYPVVFAGKNTGVDYVKVFPDEFYGRQKSMTGYCFWEIQNPDIDLTNANQPAAVIKAKGAIVFWFNLKKVLNDSQEFRNWDKVILDLLKAVKESNRGIKGEALPTGYTKDPKEIFKGFPINKIDGAATSHPYAGVRFYLDLTIKEDNKSNCT